MYGAPRPLVERSRADIRRSDPRVLDEYQGQKGTFFYSGNLGRPVAAIRERDPETEAAAAQAEARGLEACGYDPAVRVRFQKKADIEAEVMNPTRLLGHHATWMLRWCSLPWRGLQ